MLVHEYLSLCFQFAVLLIIYLQVELLGQVVILCLVFEEPPNCFFHSTFTILHSHQKCVRDPILPGAGERHSTRDKGHEEGGSAYAKAGSSLGSAPGYSRAFTLKNQSLPTLLLCALTSDFTGSCPPPPSRSLCQRANLQLQLIKFPGN